MPAIPASARSVIPADAGIQKVGTSPPHPPSTLRATERGGPILGRAADVTPFRHSGGRRNPGSRELKRPCVYILASKRNGTLYLGVTSDLVQRVWQHKNDVVEGFTKRHGVHTLVWYEPHESMESAITREKAIKEWKRAWKLELIEKGNPTWRDLYEELA